LKKVITSQEEERLRIGRELHDDTLQDLSAAIMRMDMFKMLPEKMSLDRIDAIRGIIVKALDGITVIIQNLRPTLLDDLGLVAAIKSLLDIHLGEHGVKYFITTAGVTEQRFRPEVEITLFRIVQEAVVNIARHARAQNVFVLFKVKDGAVFVDIEDDGEGYDLDEFCTVGSHDIRDRRGLGLLGMRERVTLIGGKINLYSKPGMGTRVEITIPLSEMEVARA
jgi:two-component system sensor histidine kinase NreB